MTSTPTWIPTVLPTDDVVREGDQWRASFRAMASDITVTLGPGSLHPDESFLQICDLFAAAERQCTRFDPASDLMLANAAGENWCRVGPYCYDALREAFRAYEETAGMFDPRVLQTLQRLGYSSSAAFGAATADVEVDPVAEPMLPTAPWAPRFDQQPPAVRVGPHPIDLGGIGKGLAVRWAAERIRIASPSFLLDAGGDCYARGVGPAGGPWQIGVEDPRGGQRPRAVIAITDAACVTSSIRLRQWRAGGRTVHHLIDPRTGAPGGPGLLSVTVVGSDPAEAEVWSKVFFLHGRERIAAVAGDRADVAALWVHDDGSVGMSEAMRPLVSWQDES